MKLQTFVKYNFSAGLRFSSKQGDMKLKNQLNNNRVNKIYYITN